MKNIFTLLLLFVAIGSTSAQNRYFGEIFTTVSTDSDVTYANNISVLTGTPVAENLLMDIYSPDGDTETARPVVIVVHDGSFLPLSVNGRCVGSKEDNQVVELCTRLAKYGYVAAAIDYRLGWNPIGNQDERSSTYINALYRANQDVHTAVRFFRNSADNGNPYAIDESKISVIGEGAGASIALWNGALDEIAELQLTKFFNFSTNTFMVDQSLSGNIEGTDATVLNTPSYATYSSDVNFIGALGGAVGDSTWVEAGEAPVATMHSPTNPYYPVSFGAEIVPTTGDFVTNVSGSRDIQRKANALGNNDIYLDENLNDDITLVANARNEGKRGYFPFIGLPTTIGPWQWWETSCANNTNSTATNANMSEANGLTYMDTVMNFMAPRMAFANGFSNSPEIPADNECGGATDIQSLFGGALNVAQASSLQDNTIYTSENDPSTGNECHFQTDPFQNTVWYTFVGDGNTYRIRTIECTATSYITSGDAQASVYSGADCNNLTNVACNDDEDGNNSLFNVQLDLTTEDGVTYFMLVDGYSGITGEFCLEVTQVDPSGILDANYKSVSIYPNPTEGIVNWNGINAQTAEVMDNTGRVVLNVAQPNGTVDISSLTEGIYILRLENEEGVYTSRIVKQ